MNSSIFKDDEHQQAYKEIAAQIGKGRELDCYYSSLVYLIALDNVCRAHVANMYDFEERCINPKCLSEGWQTGTSRKTTLLAFNLFTGHTDWCQEEYRSDCTPAELFCCSYAPYYYQAIKIRYPEYTS